MGKDCEVWEICYFGWKWGFFGTTTQMACGVIHLLCSYTEQWVQFFPNSESVIRGTMASLDIVLISGLYDTLGFAASVILPAKMLLQDLCKLDFGWDAAIPDKTA